MIKITFPDNNVSEFACGVKGSEIAKSISNGLAKVSVAIEIADELSDLQLPITRDSRVNIIKTSHPKALNILRHDCAHVLAYAVLQLFPETKLGFGPATEYGFYYDFLTKEPFKKEVFAKIEAKMQDIIDQNLPFIHEVWDKNRAIEYFKQQGNILRTEFLQHDIKEDTVSIYKLGDFIDLCKGPHAPNTSFLSHDFKLLKLSGVYWRADAKNVQLQRISATYWQKPSELTKYLDLLIETKKRDHRIISKAMDLYHIQEEAPGEIFWHHNGYTIYKILENYIRTKQQKYNYNEVNTPQLIDSTLWEKSGHLAKFGDDMFFVDDLDNDRQYALKPMNCPAHIQIYNKETISYKQLPIKMAEFGKCLRNEPTGALFGLMRVRAFTQDDAHIFCTSSQITSQVAEFISMIKEIYSELGFNNIAVKFSDRPKKRIGSDKLWDKAEKLLVDATKHAGIEVSINKGEGAFYGPKLEFVLKDALGRQWQCGTLQLDYFLAKRLNANYIDKTGQKKHPVIIHRAVLGSFERFIAILIEHYRGNLPLWITPIQVAIATISDKANDYAQKIHEILQKADIRSALEIKNEKISYKIRELSLKKIPIIIVVGEKEKYNQTVSLRKIGSKESKTLDLLESISMIENSCRFKIN